MVVGVFAYSAIKAALEKPVLVAVALIVGGFAILVFERLVKHPRFHSVEELPWPTAVKIGIVQCLAMIPGVSRSGATIMGRSEEHTSELQSLMRISYAVFCLKKK